MTVISHIKNFFIPPTNSIPSFHGFRVIGFFWVTCVHVLLVSDYPLSEDDLVHVKDFRTNNPLGMIYGSGTYGVEIFYVLSGYLLAQGLFSQFMTNGRIDIGKTLISRLFRLYPVILCLELIYGKISPGCPSKRELMMLGMDWPGCPFLLWSTIVDFQTWVVLVTLYALLCMWASRTSAPSLTKTEQVKTFSINMGIALFMVWVVLRAVVFIRENPFLTVETTAKHINPDTTINMMKTLPHLKWQVEINQQLFEHGKQVQFFLMRVYSNPFAKFGALSTGFLVFFLMHSSQPGQPTPYQRMLFKYHIPLAILSILGMIPLMMFVPCPANYWMVSLSHTNQLLFFILQRPLFVVIFCFWFSLILSHKLPGCPWYAKLANQLLSLPIFYPLARISYCTYAWNIFGIVIASQVIFPMTQHYVTHLTAYYLRVVVVAVLVLIPIGTATHVLVEQPGIKLHGYLFPKKQHQKEA